MKRIYQTSLAGRRWVAENTLELLLVRPEHFEFRAGQYIQLVVCKLLYRDPAGASRALSIASSMIDYVRNQLFLLGVDEARVCYEHFLGY